MNQCRMYYNAIYVSDITNIQGDMINIKNMESLTS